MTAITRGGVYWAYLDPTVCSEQHGRRPVVIVSPDVIQSNLARAIVVPVTSKHKAYPTFIPFDLDDETVYAMVDQIRTIDIKRVKTKITTLSNNELSSILTNIRDLFAE
jgi:mRNA interferase MazF